MLAGGPIEFGGCDGRGEVLDYTLGEVCVEGLLYGGDKVGSEGRGGRGGSSKEMRLASTQDDLECQLDWSRSERTGLGIS